MQSIITRKAASGPLPASHFSRLPGGRHALPVDELVKQCHQGDPAAFDALIERYQRPVYRLAYHLTGNYHDAHDLTSETFLRIYCAFETFVGAMTLPAWIRQIVRQAFAEYHRGTRPGADLSLETLRVKMEQPEGYAALTALSSRSCAVTTEHQRLLNHAIDALPNTLRRTFLLFYHEGRTCREIAEIEHVSIGAVRSRLHRGRQSMRQRCAVNETAFTH